MRDFDNDPVASTPEIPLDQRRFRLAGEDLAYVSDAPAWGILGIGFSSGDETAAQEAATGFADSILALIEPEYHEAFRRALRKKNDQGRYIVTLGKLVEVFEWVVGQVTQRPPTQPSASSTPPEANGQPSTPVSPSQGLTPVASVSGGS